MNRMNRFSFLVRCVGFMIVVLASSAVFEAAAQSDFNKLVWFDEFDKEGLPDSTRWGYDKADGCPDVCGWGNHELQYYSWDRKENARVENGHLILETRKEMVGGYRFTSARLISKYKGDFTYGRIEVKARLPKGKGLWPAIWMLPTHWKYGGWPVSGEIDIMEHVGYMPDSVFGSIHTQSYNHMIGTQKTKGVYLPSVADSFHVYAVEWTAEKISFSVNGQSYLQFSNEHTGYSTWPFDQSFHLLINLAVGGDWGGKMGVDESVFPQRMEVDYVRVYQ